MAHDAPPVPGLERVVMWRMRRADGLATHLVIGHEPAAAWAAWFLNEKAIGARDFDDLESAIRFSELMHAQNWAIGWRAFDDQDDLPPVKEE